MKKIIYTENAPSPIGPYSQAVSAEAPLVFTAGQIALDPKTGQMVGDDIKAQTRQVLLNLQALLEASGASLDSVIKTTVFLKDMNEFVAMNEVYSEFFADSKPARSTVEVVRLPRDAKVEIEAIALVVNP